jgi:hypothetical protein
MGNVEAQGQHPDRDKNSDLPPPERCEQFLTFLVGRLVIEMCIYHRPRKIGKSYHKLH